MKSPGKNEALPRQAWPWLLGFTVPGGGCFLSLCPWVGDAGDSGRDMRVHGGLESRLPRADFHLAGTFPLPQLSCHGIPRAIFTPSPSPPLNCRLCPR